MCTVHKAVTFRLTGKEAGMSCQHGIPYMEMRHISNQKNTIFSITQETSAYSMLNGSATRI